MLGDDFGDFSGQPQFDDAAPPLLLMEDNRSRRSSSSSSSSSNKPAITTVPTDPTSESLLSFPPPIQPSFVPQSDFTTGIESLATAAISFDQQQARSGPDSLTTGRTSKSSMDAATSEALAIWTAQHEEVLRAKRQAEDEMLNARKREAQEALRKWKEQRDAEIAQRRMANRETQPSEENCVQNANECNWKRVAAMVRGSLPAAPRLRALLTDLESRGVSLL